MGKRWNSKTTIADAERGLGEFFRFFSPQDPKGDSGEDADGAKTIGQNHFATGEDAECFMLSRIGAFFNLFFSYSVGF